MSEAKQDFSYHQGNTIPWRVTCRRPKQPGETLGQIVDMSGATEIRCAVSSAASDASALFSMSKTGGDIAFETDGTDGVLLIYPDAAETAPLNGQYHFEIDATFGGPTLETILTGVLLIVPSVLA
jgi:hypothetical protein